MTPMSYIESDFVNEHETARACGRRIRPVKLSWRDRAAAYITCGALWAWVGVRLRQHH